MNRWQLFSAGIFLATFCACAAQQEVTTAPDTTSPDSPQSVQRPELPCADSADIDSEAIRYSAESIYSNGAVLPREEGMACLDVLSDWLKSIPQNRWQATVAGGGTHDFDPLALADKRQELLQRFFARKGVKLEEWEWQTVDQQGLQLQLTPLQD